MGFLYNKIMKKFLLFVFAVLLVLPVFAQEDLNYSVQIILKKDASAEIQERITFYTDSLINLPALKRTFNANANIEKVAISGNMKYVDFSQETIGDETYIHALINPYLRIGKNYIVLSYTVPDAVYSTLGKDVFKWDLNISEWPYKFEAGKVSFKVVGTHIVKDTLIKIDKSVLPLEEDKEFPLTPFIDKDISVDLSFEKGFFDSHSVLFNYLYQFMNIAPIFVMFFMLIYCYILWAKYGKDPKGPFVTEYAPPRQITATFAKYLLNMKQPFDYSYFVLTLISLSLRGFIEIYEYNDDICIEPLKGSDSTGLYEEDKLIYERLFAYSPKIVFNRENSTYIGDAIMALYQKMETKKKNFYDHNSWYAVIPCLLVLLSFLLFFTLKGTWQIIAVCCFVITLIAFIFFVRLIKNVSTEFLGIYNKIMGFKQYMQIAESGRVKFSNPFDRERLFCDNLDYAYAFGIGPKILNMFSKKFDPYILMGIERISQDKTVFILSALMEPLNL